MQGVNQNMSQTGTSKAICFIFGELVSAKTLCFGDLKVTVNVKLSNSATAGLI